MTSPTEQYPFVEMDPGLGAASRLPYLPITLHLNQQSVTTTGLLDTGATVNVLPFSLGVQLGADWNQQTTTVQLSGNMAGIAARVLVVSATVGQFSPVRLAFARAQQDGMPVILGQVNFFLEFDVCVYRSRSAFEIRPKT